MTIAKSYAVDISAFARTNERIERRLADILAADVVGYNRLMASRRRGFGWAFKSCGLQLA